MISNMKEIYCKYCGLELENNSCSCELFLYANSKNEKNTKKANAKTITCDTCKQTIAKDSIYCPYCGIPVKVNGNIKTLKEELTGSKTQDVIEYYRKIDKKSGNKNSFLKAPKIKYGIVFLLLFLMMMYSLFSIIIPYIKQRILNEQIKKELLNSETVEYAYEGMDNAYLYETSIIEETSQERINLRDKWVNQGGYVYAFDKNGDPVIDDWVTATDESGNEQKYYFDVDGKLVVDSWIDGEYYVGADGAMLKNAPTPDGAFVDEDGRVLLKETDGVPVEMETHVYYESPNFEAETVVASRQKSSNSPEIRGVDKNKTYELYIKNIIQQRETVTKGDLRCNIIYYLPVIEGAKEKEVRNINEGLKNEFESFKNILVNTAKQSAELPKSITFNVVEQRTLNSNRMNIIVHGRIYPRHGLIEKKKYRFIYDRKSKEVLLADISE